MGGAEARSSSKKRLTSNISRKTPKPKMTEAEKKQRKRDCRRIFSAVLTRVLFALHAGIALWRVSFDRPKEYLYFLSIGLGCLLIEMVFAVIVRKGKEYKWFCPSVLFYLMSVVPCLWLLQFSLIDQNGICNITLTTLNESIQQVIADEPTLNRTRREVSWLLNSDYNMRESERLLKRLQRAADDSDSKKKRKNKRRRRKKNKSTTVAASIATAPESALDPTIVPLTESSKALYGDFSTRSASTSYKRNPNTESMTNTTASAVRESSTETATRALNPSTALPSSVRVLVTSPLTNSITSHAQTHPESLDTISTTATTIATVSTNSGLSSSTTMTSQSTTTANGGNVFDNLEQKINEGLTKFEEEAANLLSKTKEVIGEINRAVGKSEWILLLHQVLLFVLVIGRWLLPKGEITRDQLSQLLLVFIGVGADILEFVTETIDGDDLDQSSCSLILHYVIYGVWSWSLLQFTLVLTASKSRKTRVGFDAQYSVDTSTNGCCGNSIFASADLWGILVTLFLQDVPFLATRLYILIVYNIKHQMMIFFTGKNALVVILQIYRIVVLKISRKHRQDDTIDDAEREPLRGALDQLARRAIVMTGNRAAAAGDDIRDATFKRVHDGSVVVKIHLESEETLKRKRKKSAQSRA